MKEFTLDIETLQIERPTVRTLMRGIKSAIALDVAPGHTGIVIWNGTDTEEYGFALSEPDKTDYQWLYKLRKEFREKLTAIVKDKYFEYCIIEGVYGGENVDTTLQLSEINDVIDELIDFGICRVDNFFRLRPTEWMAKYRLIYRQPGKLVSKVETQGLLDYLEYSFYKKYKDNPESKKEAEKKGLQDKKALFFEDICDACGMLIAIAAIVKIESKEDKQKPLKISFKKDIKMVYVENLEDCNKNRDKRLREEKVEVTLGKNLKDSILKCVENERERVMYANVPVMKLGAFGIDNKFTFFKSGQGYIVFYLKGQKV